MTSELKILRRSAYVAASVTAGLLFAACGAAAGQQVGASGTVTGRFVREGGPIGQGGQQPRVVALPGVIEFTAPGKHPLTVRVGKTGAFSVSVSAGRYAVSGRTPDIRQVGASGNGPGREVPCSVPLSVVVTSGHAVKITVTCVVP